MTIRESVSSLWESVPATILSGSSMTDNINLGGLRLFGLAMPSIWTGANLTFQASLDGGATWHNIKDSSGNEITVTASAGDCVVWLPAAFSAIPMLKVRSGTSVLPVVQSQDSTIILILRSA